MMELARRRRCAVRAARAIEGGLTRRFAFTSSSRPRRTSAPAWRRTRRGGRRCCDSAASSRCKEATRDEFRAGAARGFLARPALRRARAAPRARLRPRRHRSRSASASAPRPRSSASSTACCSSRCRIPIPIASSGCSRSTATAGATSNVSEPNFEDWKNGTRSFRAMAEMASGPRRRGRSERQPR